MEEDEYALLEKQGRILEDENARLQRTLAMASRLAGEQDDEDEAEDDEAVDGDEDEEEEEEPEEVATEDEAEPGDHLEEDMSEIEAQQHRQAQVQALRNGIVPQQGGMGIDVGRQTAADAHHGAIYVPASPYPQVISVAPSPYDPYLAASAEPALDPIQIRNAVQANKHYASLLEKELQKIEAARLRNVELQAKIKALIHHSEKKTARKPGKRSFTAPYFSTSNGEVPPDNADAQRRKKFIHQTNGFKFKKWTDSEKKALATIVQMESRKAVIAKSIAQRQGNPSSDEQNQRSKGFRNLTQEEILMNLEGLDWEIISNQMSDQRYPRSAIDCKIQWIQNQWPGYNHKKKWTKEEDKQLLELAREHKGFGWQKIATQLGTNRSPAQCFQRYQRSLNTNMMRSTWTPDEDQQLREAVDKYGQKNWQQVAYCLKDRTGQQCLHRWQKTLKPEITRGRWKPQEDMMLVLAVKAYGGANASNLPWVKIQTHVPGRTDVQCRERWVNILNPNINTGPWTEEEDEVLKKAVATHGTGNWADKAKLLPRRTDNQCWRRWKALNAGEAEAYRRIVHRKRKGLVKNFVGREKERSELTIEDVEVEEAEEPQPRKSRSRQAETPDPMAFATLSPTPISLPTTLLRTVDPSILPAFCPDQPLPTVTEASAADGSSLALRPTLAEIAGAAPPLPVTTPFAAAADAAAATATTALLPPSSTSQGTVPISSNSRKRKKSVASNDAEQDPETAEPQRKGRRRSQRAEDSPTPQVQPLPASSNTTSTKSSGNGLPKRKTQAGKSTGKKGRSTQKSTDATELQSEASPSTSTSTSSSLSSRRKGKEVSPASPGMMTRSKSARAARNNDAGAE